MTKLQEQELRILGIDGRHPTMRDRWEAFYRLWRIAQHQGVYHQSAAQMSFYAICNRIVLQWVHLVSGNGNDLTSNGAMPIDIRRMMVARRKRLRLYGNNYHELVRRDKAVAAKMREQGIEVTPDDVAEVRRKIINELRKRARQTGMRIPEDDDDLLRWVVAGTRKPNV